MTPGMEDRPEDIVPLDIKPPAAGAPSAAVPDAQPMTPAEAAEVARARAEEEGLQARPVESSAEAPPGIAPAPPNAAATVATIAKKLEDWANTLADHLADALAENKKLKAELADEREENRLMAEELSAAADAS